MDNRPIGVFDSGVGGLPILYKLKKAFPSEDFVYFGDNNNMPYGNKNPEQINLLVRKGVQLLIENGVKFVVLGCNTASTIYTEGEVCGVKIIPLNPIDKLARMRRKCAFISTVATANAVRRALDNNAHLIDFFSMPDLAEKIERQVILQENTVLVDHQVTIDKKSPVLYLGCTHYLYVKQAIKTLFGAEIVLDGIDDLVNKINEIFDISGMQGQNIQTVSFVGECALTNKEIFRTYDFEKLN